MNWQVGGPPRLARSLGLADGKFMGSRKIAEGQRLRLTRGLLNCIVDIGLLECIMKNVTKENSKDGKPFNIYIKSA